MGALLLARIIQVSGDNLLVLQYNLANWHINLGPREATSAVLK